MEWAERTENRRMSIYWMKTADVYPDSRWSEHSFTALDPDARFPRFHMVEGDEPIGGVDLIEGGLQSGLWQWSMTVSCLVLAMAAPPMVLSQAGTQPVGASWRFTGTICPPGQSNTRVRSLMPNDLRP